MRPLRVFQWPEGCEWTESDQMQILLATVHSSLAKRFPVGSEYCMQFLKTVMRFAEQRGESCTDDLMQAFIGYLSSKTPTERSFKSYRLPLVGEEIYVTLQEELITIRSGTTGLRTWPAAFAMSQFLCANPGHVKGKRILELGSGPGFSGLSCVKLGAKSVFFTDTNEEVLQRLKNNVAWNMPSESQNTWSNSDIDHSILPHRVYALDWDAATDTELSGQEVDLVIASDVSYDSRSFQSLARVISGVLKSRGIHALIAATRRSLETYRLFEDALREHGLSWNEELIEKDQEAFFFDEDAGIVLLFIR
ncbi:hypothetical protein HDU97_008721 [Phlyctochytrium planicorne]|nr:hypothetical protein HDU97_008721 [Phlyctochytrium planicorne]